MSNIGTAYVDIKGDYSSLHAGTKAQFAKMAKVGGAVLVAGIALGLKKAIT